MKRYSRIVAITAIGLGAAFPTVVSADEPETYIGQANEYGSSEYRQIADEMGLTLEQRLSAYPLGKQFGDALVPASKATQDYADSLVPDLPANAPVVPSMDPEE